MRILNLDGTFDDDAPVTKPKTIEELNALLPNDGPEVIEEQIENLKEEGVEFDEETRMTKIKSSKDEDDYDDLGVW